MAVVEHPTGAAPRLRDRAVPWTSSRAPRLLLLYGLILGVVGGALLWTAVGDDWPLMPSRATELDAAFRAAQAGEPPLVGLPADGNVDERFAAGVGDDEGLFLYAPLLSDWLGLGDPRDGLKLIWIVLSMLAIAMAPPLYASLFGSMAAGLVAPIVLLGGVATLRLEDIYWVVAWSIYCLLPMVLWIAVRRPRWPLPLLVAIVVAASFASSIRSHAGLAVLLAAAAVVLTMPWSRAQRGLGAAAVVVAYLAVTPLGLSLVHEYRDHQVGRDLAADVTRSHPFWHSAYIGLGYLPNEAKIGYRDDIGWAHARREVPDVEYLSPEYERTLRGLTFDVVRDDPRFFVSQAVRKLVVLIRHAWPYLAVMAFLVPWALAIGGLRDDKLRCALLLLPALALTVLPPLMTVPARSYELGFFGLCVLLFTLAAGWVAAVAQRHDTVASVATAVRPTRRAIAGTAALLCVLVLSILGGRAIEDRAVEWLLALPPPNSPKLMV